MQQIVVSQCKRCEKVCPVDNVKLRGGETCLGKELHLLLGVLSRLPSASGAIWEKNEKQRAIFQP